MSRWVARLATVIAFTVVGGFLSGPVAVAEDGDVAQAERGVQWDVDGLTQDVIDRYGKFVTRTESGFVARIPESVERAHPAEVAAVEKAVEKANQYSQQTSASGGDMTTQASHGGVNSHWWGVTVWLDGFATNRLIALFAAGAGTSAVASAIMSWTGVGGAVAGAIAGALTAAGGVVSFCNFNGDGVDFHRSWSGPIWCTPRG